MCTQIAKHKHSPLLWRETVGATGLKKPSWNMSLSCRELNLWEFSSQLVHRIVFGPHYWHLIYLLASMQIAQWLGAGRYCISKNASNNLLRTLAQLWPKFVILWVHACPDRWERVTYDLYLKGGHLDLTHGQTGSVQVKSTWYIYII